MWNFRERHSPLFYSETYILNYYLLNLISLLEKAKQLEELNNWITQDCKNLARVKNLLT